MANLVSFVILCLLLIGRRLPRRSIKLHAVWMSGVILADFCMIGYLVFGRGAMDRVELDMSVLIYVHLAFAISLVLLYVWAIFLGVRLLRGWRHPEAMKALDRVIVPARVLTLVTSILIQLFTTR